MVTTAPGTTSEPTAYAKQRIAIRYWMLGAGFNRAAEAMDFAENHHSGRRKGGDPEFSHQVAIVSWLRSVSAALLYREDTMIAAFLHDVREDYSVEDEAIRARWGDRVADAVDALTKEFRGQRRDEGAVFDAIGADPIASVVKPGDRIHNQGTMLGAFTPTKIDAYLEETEAYILPMLKVARRRFPAQDAVYENAKLTLTSQVGLLRAVRAAQGG